MEFFLRKNTVGLKNQDTRETWLKNILAAIPPGSRILDAGAGEKVYKRYCGHLTYVSQDFAQYDGKGDDLGFQTREWNQEGLDIISDITDIPEKDSSFDAIMCVEVLEHLSQPVEALRELGRILRTGGSLVITAPFCSLTHMSPYFYQTGYSRYFYAHWLEKLGFEIKDIQANGNFFEFLAQELRRLPVIAADISTPITRLTTRLLVRLLLVLLNIFSKNDRRSSELLCFGYHVLAIKKTMLPESE